MDFPPLYADFLAFEARVFGDPPPIAVYDPYLIRYGEYRFILGELTVEPGISIVDIGCEANLLMYFLSIRGADVVGVDADETLANLIEERRTLVHGMTGVEPTLRFEVQDATALDLEPQSADAVIATSSLEHMYSSEGHGDQLAVDGIARVLKPGGVAAITVPMSNGARFHESPEGDERFAGPYRLYTPEALQERLLSNPQLETVRHAYLAQTTPDRLPDSRFADFWLALSTEERLGWGWANPILAAVFNPIVDASDGRRREEAFNTALLLLGRR